MAILEFKTIENQARRRANRSVLYLNVAQARAKAEAAKKYLGESTSRGQLANQRDGADEDRDRSPNLCVVCL
eukprot:scaffold24311_cov18-Prasinocladus_malaysianus.AAC.1